MPSEKILQQKQEKVKAVSERIKNASAIVLVDYKGISVSDDTKMRKELREAGVSYSVEKNSILEHAFTEAGVEHFLDHLSGTTAMACGTDDSVAPARILQKYSDSNKDIFNIKAGYMDGRALNADEVKAVSKLPDRNTLIAMVCGALNGTISGLARALSEVANKKSAPAEAN